MHHLKLFILISISSLFNPLTAQNRNYGGDSYNRLGIQAAVTHGGIVSDNFTTTNNIGVMAGLTTRSNVWNNFLVVYGVNFYSNKTGMMGHAVTSTQMENIDFKSTGVQLNLFAGHKIINEYLSVEAGPVLQINSKWEVDKEFENYLIEDYLITAKDLEEVSKVNLNVAGSISAGFPDVKIWIQYQYGVSNFFKNLNDGDLKIKDPRVANLEGHQGLAIAGVVYYF